MKWKYKWYSLQGAGLPCTQILNQTMLKVGFLGGKKNPFLLPLWNDKPYLVNSALVFWMTSVNLLLVVSWLSVVWVTTGKWYIGLVALLPPAVCHHVPLPMSRKGLKNSSWRMCCFSSDNHCLHKGQSRDTVTEVQSPSDWAGSGLGKDIPFWGWQ